MSKYETLGDFLSHCEPPLISVRGFEVYELTFLGVTTYPVVRVDNSEVIFSGKDKSEAVDYIVNSICLSLIEELRKGVESKG